MDYTVISKPLTIKEIEKQIAKNGEVNAVVSMPFNDIVNSDSESFLDKLTELVVGDKILSDIRYKVVGVEFPDAIVGERLHIEVWGEVELF